MDYATATATATATGYPSSSCENHPIFSRSDLLPQIEIPLATSDPGVPLLNLSILDRRIDSLRRFLSRLVETHGSIGDDQIDLVSNEIGSSIHQIILNGAALLASSSSSFRNKSFRPDSGGPTASISEKSSDLRAPTVSPFRVEAYDRTEKGKMASKPSDPRYLTRESPYLAELESLSNRAQLKIQSAEEEMADLDFSFCPDSGDLKILSDLGFLATERNPVDLKVLEEESTASRDLISSDSRNTSLEIPADQAIRLVDLKLPLSSADSRNLQVPAAADGNPGDLILPFSSDMRNLKIPGDQRVAAAGDRNLVLLKESMISRMPKNPPDAGGKEGGGGDDDDGAEIIELDSVELLAEHMHFCEICGKGFKRDANLRMHRRAHGNQFKTMEALSKPDRADEEGGRKIRFSCPFDGCNRNKAHARFRPLKSAVCVKNHFKRSHCPKMYSCNRCNKKSFSVLSDLKSHLRHCGECRWLCSCGTSFSRKDKLFGHVALFEGHMPAVVGDEQFKGVTVLEEEMQVDREELMKTADAGAADGEELIKNADAGALDCGFYEGQLEGFFRAIDEGSFDDFLGYL